MVSKGRGLNLPELAREGGGGPIVEEAMGTPVLPRDPGRMVLAVESCSVRGGEGNRVISLDQSTPGKCLY